MAAIAALVEVALVAAASTATALAGAVASIAAAPLFCREGAAKGLPACRRDSRRCCKGRCTSMVRGRARGRGSARLSDGTTLETTHAEAKVAKDGGVEVDFKSQHLS
jgi:hypothetical protein